MKYEGEIRYTSRYLSDMIGLPEDICKARCTAINGLYLMSEAKAVLKKYRAERKRHFENYRKLQVEHRCVHRVGYDYCGKPQFIAGWPYCEEHLPESARKRENWRVLRKSYRAAGRCIAALDDTHLCGEPIVKGRLRCPKHLEELKDR